MSAFQKKEVVTLKDLRHSIVAGKNNEAVTIAKSLINNGINFKEIIVDGVTKAMEYLDNKCSIEDFNLLELMLAGRAAMDVIDHLYADGLTIGDTLIDTDQSRSKKIILGSIKGDIHEIGKNIFSMIMKSYGFDVIDMGKDVDPDDLVMAAINNKADFIGISSLITTTVPYVRRVKGSAMENGLHAVKIVAGGAALKQSNLEYLNVDFVADTAFDGLHYIRSI